MKRCPRCQKTFAEDWLSFCTFDGTTLVEDERPAADLAATIMTPAPEEVSNHGAPAIAKLQASEVEPSPAQFPKPDPVEAVWQPPPPPIAQPLNKSLATASMVVGIAGIACLGPIPGIVAIVLGAVALSQIKKDPGRVGGRQAAITGIVTGSLTVIMYGGLMIFYIILIIYGLNS